MAVIKKRSVLPIYAAACVWLIWALCFPLYGVGHFLALAALSGGAYALGRFVLWRDKTIRIPDPPPDPAAMSDEERAAAELETEAHRALGEMRRLDDSIEDAHISACIVRLSHVTEQIFRHVADHPEKMSQIRRFLNYYLPTTLKLLNAYDRMDSAGVSGVNIDGTKGRIEAMMDTIAAAFDRQLDTLFGAEAMDISTDISVMEQLLAREGLGGAGLPTE